MSISTEFARTVEGRGLPLPGSYAVDPVHSCVAFQIGHLGISKVRGRFTDFSGTVTVAENVAESAVEATIQAASVDTAQPQRDAHLRSGDFFGVDANPTVEFRSTGLQNTGNGWSLRGDLTLCGVTRPVELSLDFTGAGPDAMGDVSQPRAAFAAATTIDRTEFGMTFNQALETGGWLLSKRVRIELDIQAVRR
ncbi:MAG TPA: YceI family protein [Mycobacteriales bacterium]|nr:YceI family protein [Mycobacteriales bacterium]